MSAPLQDTIPEPFESPLLFGTQPRTAAIEPPTPLPTEPVHSPDLRRPAQELSPTPLHPGLSPAEGELELPPTEIYGTGFFGTPLPGADQLEQELLTELYMDVMFHELDPPDLEQLDTTEELEKKEHFMDCIDLLDSDTEEPSKEVNLPAAFKVWERKKARAEAHCKRRVRGKQGVPRSVSQGTYEHMGASRGITALQMKILITLGIPLSFLNLLLFAEIHCGCSQRIDQDMLEMFSGQGLVAAQWLWSGHKSSTFEYKADGVNQDFTSACGLITALGQILRLKRDNSSLVWWGTVCSSWVWLCRSLTLRSTANGFLGPQKPTPFVAAGNCMLARQCLCLVVLFILKIHWCLEQPQSTVMHKTKFFEFIEKVLGEVIRVHTWQGMFGAKSQKPTFLFSHSPFIHGMKRTLDRSRLNDWTTVGLVNHLRPGRDGRQRVAGNSGLKGTEAYPGEFCQKVFETFRHREHHDLHGDVSPVPPPQDGELVDWDMHRMAALRLKEAFNIDWQEANLHEACSELAIPADLPLF